MQDQGETPAERVIRKCGGPRAVAQALGIDVTNVHRWKYPRERDGQGGTVPAHYAQALLDQSATAGWNLTPDDFFSGPTTGEAENDA